MNIAFLDYETYFSTDHSLSKMNPISYVMSPKTELQSLALQINDGPCEVVFGESDIRYLIKQIDWDNTMNVAHNNSGFDAMISAWRLGIKPKAWGCTLAMARPFFGLTVGVSLDKVSDALRFGGKEGQAILTQTKGRYLADFTAEERQRMAFYNRKDTEKCAKIFYALAPKLGKHELQLIDMTIRMLVEPQFVVNRELLSRTLIEEQGRKEMALLELASVAGIEVGSRPDLAVQAARDVAMSQPKFAALLEQLGVPCPMKPSPSDEEKLIPALAKTDEGLQELTEHPDYRVQVAAITRLGVKSTQLETRLATFMEVSNAVGGRMPVALNYCGAVITWRKSGSMKMNQQNMPRVNEAAPKPTDALRKSICAPEGRVLVVVDSSNIELRVVNTLAGEEESVERLRTGEDLYCWFASIIYGRTITKKDKLERFIGKVACIAEGELVLTDKGLIPIEKVPVDSLVWDGVEWVSHDGPIYKGEKDVITYQGLTATEDHVVYLEDGCSTTFGEARAKCRAIARTEVDGRAVRSVGSRERNTYNDWEVSVHRSGLPVREVGFGSNKLADKKAVDGVQSVRSIEATSESESIYIGNKRGSSVARSDQCNEATLHEQDRPEIQQIRSQRDRVSVRVDSGGSSLYQGACVKRPVDSWDGTGSAQQQRTLRKREYQVGDASAEFEQQGTDGAADDSRCSRAGERLEPCVSLCAPGSSIRTSDAEQSAEEVHSRRNCAAMERPVMQTKRRVWDLLNAGPRHRFTVSGRLVSNCLSLGYGSGWSAFQNMVRNQSGGVTLLDEAECRRIVNLYRQTFPRIAGKTGLWKSCETAINAMFLGNEYTIDTGRMLTTRKNAIRTPNKHWLQYPNLRQNLNSSTGKTEWLYGEGRNKSRLYGAMMTENIAQHLARLIVMEQSLALHKRYPIALSVHDEAVIVVPENEAKEAQAYAEHCFSQPPAWWPSIPLACESGVGKTYAACK